MAKRRRPIDRVRASRDGHEYHEAWTARKALQLLWPDSDLIAIAVEGVSPADQASTSAATVQVADVTMYFGSEPNFKEATKTTVAQLKYSISDRDENFRVSKAKKTIEKFSKTYQDYRSKYGAQAVKEKLDFQLITNQPISKSFAKAIDALASDTQSRGDVQKQAVQFKKASGLTGRPLSAFARKFNLLGRTSDLPTTKSELASLLVDWSATGDSIASMRLGNLRQMVRDKAGYAGTNQNLIKRIDILAAFEIGDPQDLLPCESRLPKVGTVVERAQLADAMAHISQMNEPLLIHSTGGIGKTVFMETLATKLADSNEVVFFDCFGGGAYRSPEDARHLPKMGLIHIANTLAFRSLCDPMLPHNTDVQGLLKTFRRRLYQCLDTITRMTPGRKLVLLVDAIDNASIAASQRSEDCFPLLLLASLHTEPIDGLKLIVSCRTERAPTTYAICEKLELPPFTKDETASLIRARIKNPTESEISVAQARSGGNPRVLEYVLNAGRTLLNSSEIHQEVELDELIQKRISDALETAIERGYESNDIDAFLAGLAILPPPVPLEEYAGAYGIATAAAESLAADLHPLLERTNQGLMFRDEPTETLVRDRYASSEEALRRIASNLYTRQEVSVYAARALPGLLHQLDHSEQLFELAFDDRIPSAITSTVGKRNVRYARLKAATLHAALKNDYNRLVRLLLELSKIAAVDQRGSDYILDNPDLVVAARDVDAMRRLFETRTGWPGTRHARLTTANILSNDEEEAYRHARLSKEWIEHYLRTLRRDEESDGRPKRADIGAIPFFLISVGREQDAARFLKRWRDWFTFEVCEMVFAYTNLVQSITSTPPRRVSLFVRELFSIGTLAAALSFLELPRVKRKELVVSLARYCKRETKLDLQEAYHSERHYQLQDGLRKSAAIALSLGNPSEAMTISLRAPHKRPSLWVFRDPFYNREVFSFLYRVALRAAVKKEPVHEKDVLPNELVQICSSINRDITDGSFRKKAQDRIANYCKRKRKDSTQNAPSNSLSDEDRRSAEMFLSQQLEPLLALTIALTNVLGANSRSLDKTFHELISAWKASTNNRNPYRSQRFGHFFRHLGFEIAFFVLWSRSNLGPAAVKRLLTVIHELGIDAKNLVRIVSILAQNKALREYAGEQATKARELIEKEDDVNYRATLFGALGRAMLPASIDEASSYFRNGLEQMDAIGSGDYEFTNELLLFASEMNGDELDEHEFHTLTNICELNMGEEPRKFFWGAYGRGISKAAGLRGLAKLSRWDDRSRIALQSTLMPYLTGLLEHGKINAKDALALNRLANPVERFYTSTKEFAEILCQRAGSDPSVIEELISQYQENNPDRARNEILETLATLANEVLGSDSKSSQRLATALIRNTEIGETLNERNRYRGNADPTIVKESKKRSQANRDTLKRIVDNTDPTDEASLVSSIDKFNALDNTYDLKDRFFSGLREKVPYNSRPLYIRNVAALENLLCYWKFAELKEAREAWEGSSAALTDVYSELAFPLTNAHADDFVSHGSFSGYDINKISDLTGVAVPDLVIELIKVFSRPDRMVPGSVWLAFASFICPKAEAGQGQIAVKRLLSDEAARLANNVTDGVWTKGLYPPDDFSEIASGMVWRALGSPYAIDRWRAAHCLRTFAKFDRWEVVDNVVARIGRADDEAFQAKELPFYYMHARLWLLIALARMGRDYPAQIARYKDELLSYVIEDKDPHVLMRHFARFALLACIEAGELKLDSRTMLCVRESDRSPHRRLKRKLRTNGGPYSTPGSEPALQFHLDYDFHKYDVDNLSRVFGQPCYKVAEMMSEIVHRIDPNVESMNDTGGREFHYSHSAYGIPTSCHTYGEQLGLHALFLSAGKLLKDHPVTNDWWYEDDPWGKWLSGYCLSRDDGLWLSDGTDRTPIETRVFLLERNENEFAITGNREKVLDLAELTSGVGDKLVVQGEWFSADDVNVLISSALVPSRKAATFARKLIREDPMIVWVPYYLESEEDSEYTQAEKKGYTPWIVSPRGEARLDEHDPYGVPVANFRSRLSNDFITYCSLSKCDAFGRAWKDKSGRTVLSAQAWGRKDKEGEDGLHAGTRLFCASSVLKSILTKYNKDLLVLITLQRYEKTSYRSDSRFSHTVGVARITKDFDLEYFKGRINHLHKTRW